MVSYGEGIVGLKAMVERLKPEDKALFDRFFEIRSRRGRLVLPDQLKSWAEQNLGELGGVERQELVSVVNKFTFEGASFNKLRASRPVIKEENFDFQKVLEESMGSHLCDPLSMTSEDTFGRIKGKHCITSANLAKYDALHSLIIFKKHNPLEFSEELIKDYFSVASKWFVEASKHNKGFIFPFLMWNSLWKAASSIVHGHMQVLLRDESHFPKARFFRNISVSYNENFSSDYFKDLFRVHEALGLGFDVKGAKVFVSLTPVKEKEVFIIARGSNSLVSVAPAFNHVLSRLVKSGVMSFNFGAYIPPLEDDGSWKDFPLILRIVDRGSLSKKTGDIGSMELYSGQSIIETDPFGLAELLRKP